MLRRVKERSFQLCSTVAMSGWWWLQQWWCVDGRGSKLLVAEAFAIAKQRVALAGYSPRRIFNLRPIAPHGSNLTWFLWTNFAFERRPIPFDVPGGETPHS